MPSKFVSIMAKRCVPRAGRRKNPIGHSPRLVSLKEIAPHQRRRRPLPVVERVPLDGKTAGMNK